MYKNVPHETPIKLRGSELVKWLIDNHKDKAPFFCFLKGLPTKLLPVVGYEEEKNECTFLLEHTLAPRYTEDVVWEYEWLLDVLNEGTNTVDNKEIDSNLFSKTFNSISRGTSINSEALDPVNKYPHYYKDVSNLSYVDVYRLCFLFEIDDPSGATQHAIKKLVCSGKRGAKDKLQDLKEAKATIERFISILEGN